MARRRRRHAILPDLRHGDDAHRDRISVNARCIDGIDVFTLEATRYDGRTQMPPGPAS